MTALPVLGAAVTCASLEGLRNWLFDAERDVELQDFHMPELLDGDWRSVAAREAELLSGHRGRIGIHGPFWSLPLDSFDPEIAAVCRRRLLTGLDVCAAVGADQMVIHSPFSTWDSFNLRNYDNGRDGQIARVLENLRPVVARAEDQGVTLVVENIEDREPEARVELARAFESKAVRLSVDTGHAHYAHGATGAPPVDYFISAAGALLEHVHLQDADGYADRHWVPGEGTILWPSIFAALRRTGAAPRLILELRDHSRIVEGAERLAAMGLAR
ncbi:MAG: sugar phosphate isomerase/epimerase family protein [Rubrimonas sp.]|uniref:sugar phosphate isomerase/epimerase family protein n=1 Tax=Rubrimonas sp. TaxID=2036015 RepID=UPI002FDEC071